MSNATSVFWKEYFANDKKKARITIALFSVAKHKVLRHRKRMVLPVWESHPFFCVMKFYSITFAGFAIEVA